MVDLGLLVSDSHNPLNCLQVVQSDIDYMLKSTQTVIDAILARRFVPRSLDPARQIVECLPGTPTRPSPPPEEKGSGSWPTLKFDPTKPKLAPRWVPT